MNSNVTLREVSEVSLGRREMLVRYASLFGAGALLVGSASGQLSPISDATLLNYALTLENLETAFYTQGLVQFSSADFANSTFIQNFGAAIGGDVYAYLCLIRDHEMQHVAKLQALITGLGGVPVKPCNYSFNCRTADDFAALADLLENTGVTAYDGLLQLISNLQIKTAAATIATVEARHASYLNLLTGTSPSPASLDTGANWTTVQTALSKYITAC